MRAYLITTGVMFGLVAVVHVWRTIEEGPSVLKNPAGLISTMLAMAPGVLSWRLLRKTRS